MRLGFLDEKHCQFRIIGLFQLNSDSRYVEEIGKAVS